MQQMVAPQHGAWIIESMEVLHNLIINSKWTVRSGMLAGQCLFMMCYIVATVYLSISVSNKNNRYFVPIYTF